MLMDTDTLATLQHERYRNFVREAEQLRLLRVPNGAGNPFRSSANKLAQVDVASALYQLLLTTMPARIRAVLPR